MPIGKKETSELKLFFICVSVDTMSYQSNAASLQLQLTNPEYDKNKKNINSLCYCGKSLEQSRNKWSSDWVCLSCCQEISKSITTFYKCNQGRKCIYNQITGIDYGICRTCYNENTDESSNDKYGFLHNKFRASLTIISLVKCVMSNNQRC